MDYTLVIAFSWWTILFFKIFLTGIIATIVCFIITSQTDSEFLFALSCVLGALTCIDAICLFISLIW